MVGFNLMKADKISSFDIIFIHHPVPSYIPSQPDTSTDPHWLHPPGEGFPPGGRLCGPGSAGRDPRGRPGPAAGAGGPGGRGGGGGGAQGVAGLQPGTGDPRLTGGGIAKGVLDLFFLVVKKVKNGSLILNGLVP